LIPSVRRPIWNGRETCNREEAYLAEVFEDNSDVHVDDDEKADDEVGYKVHDGDARAAAVAVRSIFAPRRVAVGRLVVHQAGQHAIPPGRRRCLEQQDHALEERLEVEDVVDAVRVPDVHEERHAEYGVDEHDEKKQKADVEQRRQRYGQREQQRPNALGRLDESQDAPDTKHADDPQQSRRHVQLWEHICHGETWQRTT